MTQKNNNLNSVQILRALAAGWVVLFHSGAKSFEFIEKYGFSETRLYDYTKMGSAGVDIFFVISGFIMTYVMWDLFREKNIIKNFLLKRFIRIAPIYWFYTSIVIVALLIAPRIFDTRTFDLNRTILSYLFLPANSDRPYILEVAWTLTFEMYFYFIFAFCLLFSRKWLLPILGVTFFVPQLLGHLFNFDSPIFFIIKSSLLWEFFMGVLIGYAFKKNIAVNTSYCLFSIAAGVVLFAFSSQFDNFPRGIQWGIPSALIVGGGVLLNKVTSIKSTVLEALGDSSYSLYLSHCLYLPVFGKIFVLMNLQRFIPSYGFIILGFVSSVIVGHVLFLIIEKPLVNYLSKKLIH